MYLLLLWSANGVLVDAVSILADQYVLLLLVLVLVFAAVVSGRPGAMRRDSFAPPSSPRSSSTSSWDRCPSRAPGPIPIMSRRVTASWRRSSSLRPDPSRATFGRSARSEHDLPLRDLGGGRWEYVRALEIPGPLFPREREPSDPGSAERPLPDPLAERAFPEPAQSRMLPPGAFPPRRASRSQITRVLEVDGRLVGPGAISPTGPWWPSSTPSIPPAPRARFRCEPATRPPSGRSTGQVLAWPPEASPSRARG